MEKKSFADLNLQELKHLKTYSLYMIQWGWFVGILGSLISLPMISEGIWLGFLLLPWAVSRLYIYAKCRTDMARAFVFIDSLAGMVFSGIALVLGNFLTIIFFLIDVFLFLAARHEILWGDNRATYQQIKFAYNKKSQGVDYTEAELPPRKGNNPVCDMAFTVIGYLSLLTYFLSFVKQS